jgi:hypothetical protein
LSKLLVARRSGTWRFRRTILCDTCDHHHYPIVTFIIVIFIIVVIAKHCRRCYRHTLFLMSIHIKQTSISLTSTSSLARISSPDLDTAVDSSVRNSVVQPIFPGLEYLRFGLAQPASCAYKDALNVSLPLSPLLVSTQLVSHPLLKALRCTARRLMLAGVYDVIDTRFKWSTLKTIAGDGVMVPLDIVQTARDLTKSADDIVSADDVTRWRRACESYA